MASGGRLPRSSLTVWVDRIRSPLGWTMVMDALLVVCDVVAAGMTSNLEAAKSMKAVFCKSGGFGTAGVVMERARQKVTSYVYVRRSRWCEPSGAGPIFVGVATPFRVGTSRRGNVSLKAAGASCTGVPHFYLETMCPTVSGGVPGRFVLGPVGRAGAFRSAACSRGHGGRAGCSRRRWEAKTSECRVSVR